VEQLIVHIVDDDHQLRAMASYLLRGAGYHTEIYGDGEEFLKQARLERGCIVLDIRMPGMSGIEVQEELRQRGSTLPVIVLTGCGDVGTAVRAMKLGALDFLEKPYTDETLLAAVNGALHSLASAHERDQGARAAREKVAALSARECQVLQGLLAGMANKEVARRLDLSVRTIEMHRAHMMDRLQVGSLSEAVRVAMEARLEPLDPIS